MSRLRFKTKSGSLYELDRKAMTWARLKFDSEVSPFVRTNGGDLTEWPTVELGKPVEIFGTALDPAVKQMRGFRWIETTPVVEIEEL